MLQETEMPAHSPVVSWTAQFSVGRDEFLALLSLPLISTSVREGLSGPATVIRACQGRVTSQFLAQTFARFKSTDDVFSDSFLKTILVAGAEHAGAEDDALRLVSTLNATLSFVSAASEQIEGPCFIMNGRCYGVCKLFPDVQEAFFVATLPAGKNKYQSFHGGSYPTLSVAVPSRLYYPKLPSKPLNGLRISVKDNIDLKGVKTSLSSRAWNSLYQEVTETAPALQRLIDLGAVIVGKTKLSQFAETEYPTADWVDYHCPFNPRGDGYLTPEGSSSGAAAGLAAYDWLDISIATDTGGSIRDPSAKQGLFAIRPTFDSQPFAGIFPLAHALDTLGLLTRDASILEKLCNIWYPKPTEITVAEPIRLIHLSEYDYQSDKPQQVFERFVTHVEAHLGIQRITIRLEDVWNKSNPSGKEQSILEFIGKGAVMKTIKNFDLWHNTEAFRSDYRSKFGREPYVNPPIALKWAEASQVTKSAQEAALERKGIFQSWFLKEILSSNKTIIVLPLSDSEPEYRDDYADGPWAGGSGFHRNFISTLTGCPELIVPIGQIP